MAGVAARRDCSTRGPGLGVGLPPDHPHPSRNRPQIALFRSGQDRQLCRHRRGRGDELIAELGERMTPPNSEYHHVWRKGDIVIWDNRCSYHRAAGDYPPEEDRIHWRVSINDYGVEALEALEAAE